MAGSFVERTRKSRKTGDLLRDRTLDIALDGTSKSSSPYRANHPDWPLWSNIDQLSLIF